MDKLNLDLVRGEHTGEKLSTYSDLISEHIRITKNVIHKRDWPSRDYLYIETHAGPGLYPSNDKSETHRGGPLLFMDVATRNNINCSCALFEKKPSHAESLRASMDGFGDVYGEDYKDHLDYIHINKNQMGMLFVDPTGVSRDLDMPTLRRFTNNVPTMEIMIYISATAIKRVHAVYSNIQLLDDMINSLNKKFWRYRAGIGKQQYTFLFGSNSSIFKKYKKIKMYRLDDEGKTKAFDRLRLTVEEYKSKYPTMAQILGKTQMRLDI